MADGTSVDIGPATPGQLRWRRLDGRTGALTPQGNGRWTSTLGWTDRPDGHHVTISDCGRGEIRFNEVAGRRLPLIKIDTHFQGNGVVLAGRLTLARGISVARAEDRAGLCRQFDRLRRELDVGDTMARMDHYRQQALEMVLSGKAQQAFRVDQEPDRVRDAYGRHSLGERTLLARRLVEAGVTFVTVSGAFGVFDNHGDDVIWKGMIKGLKPLLPRVDQAVHALVTDLEARGLLDDTLVLAMGEFGRSPVFSQRGTGGREHWPNCMSMLVAGGGLAHGQVVGSTDATGGDVKEARVTPADLGATVFRHLGIDLGAQWVDSQGRPHSIVTDRPCTCPRASEDGSRISGFMDDASDILAFRVIVSQLS